MPSRLLLAGALTLAIASDALGQVGARPPARPQAPRGRPAGPPRPGPERIRIVMNAGVVMGQAGFDQAFTLPRNAEQASVSSNLTPGSAFAVDGGARVRVTRTLSVGASLFVALAVLGMAPLLAGALGAAAGFGVRAGAIRYRWTLPGFRS